MGSLRREEVSVGYLLEGEFWVLNREGGKREERKGPRRGSVVVVSFVSLTFSLHCGSFLCRSLSVPTLERQNPSSRSSTLLQLP